MPYLALATAVVVCLLVAFLARMLVDQARETRAETQAMWVDQRAAFDQSMAALERTMDRVVGELRADKAAVVGQADETVATVRAMADRVLELTERVMVEPAAPVDMEAPVVRDALPAEVWDGDPFEGMVRPPAEVNVPSEVAEAMARAQAVLLGEGE